MNYELIKVEDYDQLPDEPDLKFAEIVRICDDRLAEFINEYSSGPSDSILRMKYMSILSAAADELDIPGVATDLSSQYSYEIFNKFTLAVHGAVTRIRLRNSSRESPYSVKLSLRTKALIRHEIERIRTLVNEADILDQKRRRILDKLKELEDEIECRRTSFAKVMGCLTMIGALGVGSVSFMADLPGAISAINTLIGEEKEVEYRDNQKIECENKRMLPQKSLVCGPSTVDDDLPF